MLLRRNVIVGWQACRNNDLRPSKRLIVARWRSGA
jgi:hypothetical protein